MREEREGRETMKIMYLETLKNTKKRRSIGKECLLHVEISKKLRFPEKKSKL